VNSTVAPEGGKLGMDRSEMSTKISQGGLSMLKGFRDFIMRGNVVDLAVGIVVGAAFTGLVTSFTTDFIKPLINVFGGGKVKAGVWTFHHQNFLWSDFVNSIINFLIVAAVLYFFVVMPLNKLAERRNRNKTPEPVQVSDEVAVLIEIRDALRAGTNPAPAQRAADQLVTD
jgi:large conductance mechanosensitive channel